jgi:hypothetical protein
MMKDKTTLVIVLCVGAFVLAMLARFYMTGNFVKMVSVASAAAGGALQAGTRETFMQMEKGAPAYGGGMQGVYSGIDISNGNSWSQATAPVDMAGWKSKDDITMTPYNDLKSTPECCLTSSTSMSTDSGCICMSKAEEKKLAYRGGNRTSA